MATQNSSAGFLGNLRLSMKLGLAFGLMILLLAAAVTISINEVGKVKVLGDRVVELRTPTAQASLGMLNGMNESLAALRGWILLGNPKFKEERARAWNTWIDPNLEKMRAFSKNWTNPENVKRLNQMDALLVDFRKYQEEIEEIANTIDQKPAEKMLFQDAAPRAAKMASLITRMIDLEGKLEATTERKAILYMMADVRGTTGLALANIRAFLLSGDRKFKDNYESLWAKNTRRFNDLERQYNNLSAEQRVAFDQFKSIRAEFQTYPPKMFKIRASKQADLANYWLGSRAAPTAARIVNVLNAMVDNQRKLLETDASAMDALIVELERMEWILLVAGVAIALLLAFFLTRMIAGPITRIADTVHQIAEHRDLTIEVPVGGRDEIGVMAQAFNNMMKVIRETFGVVNDSAHEVATSSLDVAERASGNKKRAQGQLERAQTSEKIISEMGNTAGQVSAAALAQKQAAEQSQESITELLNKMDSVGAAADAQDKEVTETMARVKEMGETGAKVVGMAGEQGQKVVQVTASIEEMSAAVENMQKTVAQASEYGKAALEAADEGHKSVSSTVEGMRAIAESSEQISEIIGVITEIAEQTNLLALNAAVEAARAGVHGKGFAVVADEVGKLAQRSSEAAKEITTLIKSSAASVSEGVALTDQSQQALARIDERTRVNIQAIDEIAEVSTTLAASTTEVQELVQELNVLARNIGEMGGEQGARREAAEKALDKLMEYSKSITGLINEANQTVAGVSEAMSDIVNRGEEMANMTDLQAQRSRAITKLAKESAEVAVQTAEGAGTVVSITDALKEQSQNLTHRVRQFRIG